jgi:YD repeat-containing protein
MDNPVINQAPSWSSTNRIAFASNSTGQFEIWTINADGSNLTQVTTNGGYMPNSSPDGSLIAFASNRSGNSQIYSIPAPASYVPSATIGQPGANNPQATYAEPVSTGNGNYVYQHTDFTIPGRGMPLVLQRSYNALDNYSGPLGANWTHSYNVFAIQTAMGVVIKWGDGHGETYTLSGGVYIPQPGVFSSLVQNSDNALVLTQKNQTRYLFSTTGILTSIVDKNGNTIALTYRGGNLTQITDMVGRNLTLSYDGSNRIILVSDPIGRTASFSYSATNDLAQATDAAAGVTQYTYDTSHHVTSITLPNGQTLLQNIYDSSDRVITQTNGRGFTTTFAYNTPSSGQTTITDARGNQTVHTYDSSLRINTIADALGGTVGYPKRPCSFQIQLKGEEGMSTTEVMGAPRNRTSDQVLVEEIRLDQIHPPKTNPRRRMDLTGLAELAANIRVRGVLQPILVRPFDGAGYQIVCGERRWRASKEAGRET